MHERAQHVKQARQDGREGAGSHPDNDAGNASGHE